ncbi:MAG: MaoC family dehydratase [Pseudomonadota bacterium]
MTQFQTVTVPEFLVPGCKTGIGEHTFEAEEVIEFAKQFDPQTFHVDPEAAKSSLFGGLCASGWHTASIWMKLQRHSVQRLTEQLKEKGKTYPEFGPSPGMDNLKWHAPVFAGDTISYFNTPKEFRRSNSKPQWWVLQNFSEGVNQNGIRVISFESVVFVKLLGA